MRMDMRAVVEYFVYSNVIIILMVVFILEVKRLVKQRIRYHCWG